MPTFNYTVDDEPQATTAHELTPTRVLNNAGLDPTMHYLVQLQGNHRESYQNRPDATIRVDEHMNIHLGFDRPTPVS